MKKLLSLLMVSVMVFSLAGCSKESSTSPTQTLTVGAMGSVDILPLVVAQENGYFEEQGLDLNLEIFKNSKDRDAALQAGELDGVLADQVAIAIYQNAGIDMQITGMTDGLFQLVAGKDSGITSIQDMVGKKVAISENTIIEYTLDQTLLANGIAVDSIEKIVIPPLPTRLEMLNAGEVDAALMPNPFSDAALSAGGTLVTAVDSQTGDYISITGFLQEAIDTKLPEIEAFYRAYNQGVEYLNSTDISEFEDTVISVVGYPEAMKGNISLPLFKQNELPKNEQIEKVFAWAKEKGILALDITAEDVTVEISSK